MLLWYNAAAVFIQGGRMRTGSIFRSSLFGLLCWLAPAHGAEVAAQGTVVNGDLISQKLSLKGPIVAGDTERVRRLIHDEQEYVITLQSQGGDFNEGLKLAAYFNERLIGTVVEPGAACYSACAIAFLGGTMSGEEGSHPARSIGANARLAFHAPFLNIQEASFDKASVEMAYDKAVKTITDFVAQTRKLDITPDVAAEMMTPQRRDMFVVDTVAEVQRVGIEIQEVRRPKVLTLSMAKNLCGNAWNWNNVDPSYRARINDLIASFGWRPDKAKLTIRTDYFGKSEKVTRLLIPTRDEEEGEGYYWCMLDIARRKSDWELSCRGYVIAPSLGEALSLSREFDDPAHGEYGNPDSQCAVSGALDPLDRLGGNNEERWALVPEDTSVADVGAVLAKYVADEPPL